MPIDIGQIQQHLTLLLTIALSWIWKAPQRSAPPDVIMTAMAEDLP